MQSVFQFPFFVEEKGRRMRFALKMQACLLDWIAVNLDLLPCISYPSSQGSLDKKFVGVSSRRRKNTLKRWTESVNIHHYSNVNVILMSRWDAETWNFVTPVSWTVKLLKTALNLQINLRIQNWNLLRDWLDVHSLIQCYSGYASSQVNAFLKTCFMFCALQAWLTICLSLSSWLW